MRKFRLLAATAAVLLTVILARTADALAAPQKLDCVLTDTKAQLGSENRSIAVTFDEAANTLKAQEGSQSYSFSNVLITYVSISGDVDSVTLGLDRSSLGIVWQQYGADQVVTEFGQCRPTNHPAAADTH